MNKPSKIVPQERLDSELPGIAYDLMPSFEKYKTSSWHANYIDNDRSPFASIYTSLGCIFKCEFCMINILNRDDLDEVGVAGNYNKMRFWSPEFIIKEFDKLVEMGVETIRIADEMFLLNPKYYVPLTKMLSERPYADRLRMWAYSRVDTVKRLCSIKN